MPNYYQKMTNLSWFLMPINLMRFFKLYRRLRAFPQRCQSNIPRGLLVLCWTGMLLLGFSPGSEVHASLLPGPFVLISTAPEYSFSFDENALSSGKALSLPVELSFSFDENVLSLDTGAIKKLIDSSTFYSHLNTTKSIDFAKKALVASEAAQYALGEIRSLMRLASAFYIKGEYDTSLQYGARVQERSTDSRYGPGKAFVLNNRGLIFLSQDNFEAALNEFQAALQENRKQNALREQGSNYFNIGVCHLDLKQLDAAGKAFKQSFDIARKAADPVIQIMALNRLADIACQRGQYAQSIALYQRAISENQQNDWEFTFSYTGMAEAQLANKTFSAALQSAQSGLQYAQKLEANWDMARAAKILHQAYAAAGQFEEAYRYALLDISYRDSLFNEKKEREINGILLKQKQIENEDLKQGLLIKQQQDRLNQLIIAIIAMVTLFMAIILWIIYRKNKQIYRQNRELAGLNRSLEDLNHSKDQLFSVIGHDLRSPIVSIIQTVDLLRSEHLSVQEGRLVLDNFFEKLTATATMLDNLLLWASDQRKEMRIDKTSFLLPALIDQLLLLLHFQAKEKQIHIQHDKNDAAMIYADVNHVRIIFQNLISNAIKFTPEGGTIYIHSFVKTADNKTGMVIRDTGIGMTPTKLGQLFNVMGKAISTSGTANEEGIGIGLMLVKKYADENNAQIIVNSDSGGTEFVIVFDTRPVL